MSTTGHGKAFASRSEAERSATYDEEAYQCSGCRSWHVKPKRREVGMFGGDPSTDAALFTTFFGG